MTDETQQRGPAWYDVEQALADFEKVHSCHVDLIIRRKAKPVNGQRRLLLRVEASQIQWTAELGVVLWRGYDWPNPDHRTMPGLMMRALHELGEELFKRAAAAEEATQKALPF